MQPSSLRTVSWHKRCPAGLARPREIEPHELYDLFFGHLPVEAVLHGSNDLVSFDHPVAIQNGSVLRGLCHMDQHDDDGTEPGAVRGVQVNRVPATDGEPGVSSGHQFVEHPVEFISRRQIAAQLDQQAAHEPQHFVAVCGRAKSNGQHDSHPSPPTRLEPGQSAPKGRNVSFRDPRFS